MMDTIYKRLAIAFGFIVLFVFFTLIGAAWYLGAFAAVEIETGLRGPYQTVCLENKGSYYTIPQKTERVADYLKNKAVSVQQAIAIFKDDPAVTPESDLISYGGYIINDSISLDSAYVFKTVARRNVVIAKIKAHPLMAPFKTYPRIREWLQDNDRETDTSVPVIEIYHNSGIVEVQISLKPQLE